MAYISFQPNDYFNTKLWTGTDATHAITGVGFEPDLVWIKGRTTAYNHVLNDQVRGVNKELRTSGTNAEITQSDSFTSFDSDGFTLGADSSDQYNNTSNNYVGWSWRASGTSGSANTDGSINTTATSVNTTSGFSISTYTGTGSNATVGHGLGVAPKCFILKKTSDTSAWSMYHESVGNTKFLTLNGTGAATTGATVWNNTSPTSSVFSVGTGDNGNASGATYVAYCFAEKTGFSKFSSFVGNGNADGTFVYTGFKPAFIIVKASSISGNEWNMWDNKRNPSNVADKVLWSNTSNTEAEIAYDYDIDMLSNGFKARTANARLNQNGATYIFMAFAESPLVSSNGVPAVAR